ncbi:ATP-binding protein [candidate division KSB1 bacterium]|nr:ATP-binding protein [candidate division KSB1 bacterium]
MSFENRNKYQLVIESDLNNIKNVEQLTEKIADYMNFQEDDKDSLAIAVTEIVGNAINHGNKGEINKKVTVDFEYKNNTITVTIYDEGKGFDADKIENPLEPENLLKESGRGIFIVRALMDKVEFIRTKNGSAVRLTKKSQSDSNIK